MDPPSLSLTRARVIVRTGRERKPRDGTDRTEGDTDGEASGLLRPSPLLWPSHSIRPSAVPAERALTSTGGPQPCFRGGFTFIRHKVTEAASSYDGMFKRFCSVTLQTLVANPEEIKKKESE